MHFVWGWRNVTRAPSELYKRVPPTLWSVFGGVRGRLPSVQHMTDRVRLGDLGKGAPHGEHTLAMAARTGVHDRASLPAKGQRRGSVKEPKPTLVRCCNLPSVGPAGALIRGAET